MSSSNMLARQGHRLLQTGVCLLIFLSFEGFVIPFFVAPGVALAAHRLAALQGVLLLALGVAWSRLDLRPTASRIAFWTLIYSTFALLGAYVLAAIWGVGTEAIPLAAGGARGSALQEAVIKIVLYSSAPTALVSLVLILWGLRLGGARPNSTSRA